MLAEVKVLSLIKLVLLGGLLLLAFGVVIHAQRVWDELVDRVGPVVHRLAVWWESRREHAARRARWAVWPVRRLGARARRRVLP